MKKTLLLIFGIILMSNLLWSQEVTNVTASQRTDGSKLLDVFYDLSGTETQYTISLEISFDDGVSYQEVSEVSGDVGAVEPATGLQLTWDAATEFPDGFYSEAMKVKVNANIYEWTCGEDFTDARDGQTYNTVQIGDQCWMAENLAYLPEVSPSSQGNNSDPFYYVYDYQGTDVNAAKATDNYSNYGALYNWPASLNACPEGSHLPTDAEWTVLTTYLGGESVAGGKMKETGTTHWNSPNNGATNSSGFTGLPGGGRYTYGSFTYIGYYGFFWSSTEYSTPDAWNRYLHYNYDDAYRNYYTKGYGLSVRCLRDVEQQNSPPESPTNPNPENESTNQAIETTLQWSCSDPENDPLTYDIYFGIENNPDLLAAGQSETNYDLGTLLNNIQCYWKIVAHDDQGNSTEGPVWSFTTEENLVLTIGDEYQGGIIAYILQPGDPGYIEGEAHGLIAAPSDQSTGTQWGCYGTSIPGADGTALGTGYQNTLDIVADCSTAGIAAQICNDLELNGYIDWYLPSKDELNKLYMSKDLIGGFAADRYWSSSEYSSIYAWGHYFSIDFQSGIIKVSYYRVRAVRAF